jgi:hypothetical protein
MSKNSERRRIYGIKKQKVIDDWRKLRNEKFHSLCCSLTVTRVSKTKTHKLSNENIRQNIGALNMINTE